MNEIPLDAFESADKITVEVSHSSRTVDTREPLTGEPVEFSNGELAVRSQGHAFFVKKFDHDDDTYLATKARSTSTTGRHRGTTFTVESIETQWSDD